MSAMSREEGVWRRRRNEELAISPRRASENEVCGREK
jgi:hypothetical protein